MLIKIKLQLKIFPSVIILLINVLAGTLVHSNITLKGKFIYTDAVRKGLPKLSVANSPAATIYRTQPQDSTDLLGVNQQMTTISTNPSSCKFCI
jgi:hypothetical protein